MQTAPDDAKLTAPGEVARTIPIVREEAFVTKQAQTEQVRVRSSVEEEQVLVRDTVSREAVEISHVPIEREVSEAPRSREEDGVTIIPVIEERVIVEKRLFLVEEIHVRRTSTIEPVTVPTTLRRTRIEVERSDLSDNQKDI